MIDAYFLSTAFHDACCEHSAWHALLACFASASHIHACMTVHHGMRF
jgi:hypothetical protein